MSQRLSFIVLKIRELFSFCIKIVPGIFCHILDIGFSVCKVVSCSECFIKKTRYIFFYPYLLIQNIFIGSYCEQQIVPGSHGTPGVCVFHVVQLFIEPMDCSLSGSSVHEIFQTRILESCHFLLQRIFPAQGSNPHLLYWWAGSLILSHLGSLRWTSCLFQWQIF